MYSHLLRPVTIADSSGSDDPSLFHKTIKTPLLGYQNSHLQTNKVLCLLAEYCGMELLMHTLYVLHLRCESRYLLACAITLACKS